MRHLALAPALALLLALAACGGDALEGVRAQLKGRDYPAAGKALEALVQQQPGLERAHYLLFALDRFMLSQADAASQDALSKGAVREYDWITAKEGLARSYGDMEASLQASDRSKALYGEARQAVYGAP
jgi:hypothetical protein